jgi:hypothetical protein
VEGAFEAERDRRPTESSEIEHLVLAGLGHLGRRYVSGTFEQAKQAGHSMILLSSEYAEPTRWFSKIKYRSSPKTFYNGSAAGHVRKDEWLTSRP